MKKGLIVVVGLVVLLAIGAVTVLGNFDSKELGKDILDNEAQKQLDKVDDVVDENIERVQTEAERLYEEFKKEWIDDNKREDKIAE